MRPTGALAFEGYPGKVAHEPFLPPIRSAFSPKWDRGREACLAAISTRAPGFARGSGRACWGRWPSGSWNEAGEKAAGPRQARHRGYGQRSQPGGRCSAKELKGDKVFAGPCVTTASSPSPAPWYA